MMIDIEDVSVAYGQHRVLDSIDLQIEEGEFVCVLGQTGCGKSTLLRLILGSEKPSRGQVLVDGRVHDQPDRTRGYVPQKYALFPDKTVLENITFGCEVSEFGFFGRLSPRYYSKRREFRREAMEYLRRTGLSASDASKYPDQLSGGMQQRVAIAQALITKPRILLMDEAFSALDPATRRGMQGLLRNLWRDLGTTILFVTHNTHEALTLGSRVIVLAKQTASAGSRIVHDMPVPESCEEDEVPAMVRDLERVAVPVIV
jgi:NitT/TauT family transport system ATP-binding protein